MGTYRLQPGTYGVLVESLNDPSTRPWTGVWALSAGYEYPECFLIVTTFGP